ncbi:MAG: TldD/PmbA family protein [candidate division NC10 bacterium]|nr:TldD/PmbA family protein [candidate division NC10 bacterium]
MNGESLQYVHRGIQEALAAGAEAVEGFLLRSTETTVEVKEGQVNTFALADEAGLGLRLILDRRMGFNFTSDLSQGAFHQLIEDALQAAKASAPDPSYRFPEPFSEYPWLPLHDPSLKKVSVEEKIDRARALERAALVFDTRIRKIRKAAYRDADYHALIVNSLGLQASFSGTYCTASTSVVAEEDGEAETGWEFDFARSFQELRVEEVGKKAAERAVRMLGAKALSTRRTDVLLDPGVASDFLELLASALSGEAVQKGKSLLAGKVGQRIGSEMITLIDDGTFLKGMFAAPCDGEGVPSCRTILVDAGVLQGYLYDTYHAVKAGTRSTASARRSGYRLSPEVGPSNLFIEPGQSSPSDLMQAMGRGLYILSALGMHTANPVSGDFSIGVEGFWVEEGRIAFPVRGVTLAGNVLELLQQVDGVGADLRFFGRTGSPTLLVQGLQIAGD